jgi:SAM-dependent methyltransferase
MDNQEITIKTYEDNLDRYKSETPSVVEGDFKKLFDLVIGMLPRGTNMLEIGSGLGRDANYFEENGLVVKRTDVASSFIKYQTEQGKEISKLNVLEDEITRFWDVVFANAVFLHFTPEQFDLILRKIFISLNDGGILVFTIKQGEGEEYSTHKMNSPRYFHYWTEESLWKIVIGAGFSIMKLYPAFNDTRLFCIAVKI